MVQVGDRSQYGREEVWALPSPRGGDCEDLALLKKKLLIEAGLPADRLRIATVLDRRRNAHAGLVLRTEAGDYVLDSLTDRVLPWEKTGLSFLRIQSQASPTGWAMVLAGGIFRKS